MRKTALMLLGLVALTGIGAAAPYSINLLSPTAETHLTMQGRLSAQQVSAGSSEVAFTYTMRIPDSAPINRSQMDVWRFGAVAANETYTTDIDTVTLDQNATSSGHVVIPVEHDVTAISRVFVAVNHTATYESSGAQPDVSVRQSFPVSFEPQDQSIDAFRTNATNVTRGERIYVNGTVTNINSMNISGTVHRLSSSRFELWLPVPTDREPGQQDLSVSIETETGEVFVRQLPVTVQNRVPELTVSPPAEVEQNTTFTAPYTVEDDTPGHNVTVSGIDATVNEDSIEAYPNKIARGIHRFNVTVQDRDGASTTTRTNVTIVVPGADNQQDGDGNGDGDENGDGEEQPTSIPIIGAVREFMVGVVQALLGLQGGG